MGPKFKIDEEIRNTLRKKVLKGYFAWNPLWFSKEPLLSTLRNLYRFPVHTIPVEPLVPQIKGS